MAGLPCIDVTDPLCEMVKSCQTTTTISDNSYINESGTSYPLVQTNQLLFSGGELTSTVNGVVSNSIPLSISTTNVLDSAANVMTSTVNGVADTAPIVNSNAITFDSATNTLTSDVNGVVDTEDLCVLRSYGATVRQQGNPTAGATVAGGTLSPSLTQPAFIIVNNLSTCRSMVGSSVYDVTTHAVETTTKYAWVSLRLMRNVNGGVASQYAVSDTTVGPISLTTPNTSFWGLHLNGLDAWTIAPGASRIEVGQAYLFVDTPSTSVQVAGAFVRSTMTAFSQ